MLSFKKIDLQKLPYKKILLVGQFLVIIFCVRSCHLKDLTINNDGLKIQMYQNQVQTFEKEVNKLGEKLTTQDQLIISKNKALEKELLKNSNLKSLNEQIKFQAETKIKNIIAEYSGNGGIEVITLRDTIIKDGDTSIVEGIRVGTKFKADTSKWYSVSGSIEKEGIKFDSLSFKSDFTLNIGEKRVKGIKGWLFGKTEPKIELINPNPYIEINVMKNIKLENKKWWNNGWVKFGAGFLLGGGLIILAN